MSQSNPHYSRDPDSHEPARRALLVQQPGPRRAGLSAALSSTGWQVEEADEPYAATARFVDSPCDLVVVSLGRFRKQDTAFLGALRERRPDVRILVLVPARRRAAAAKALAAGADAQLPEPCFPEELAGAVEALFRRTNDTSGQQMSGEGLRLLAGEVAHAINNPLQILSLIGEADGLPAARAQDVRASVARIRSVTRILASFGGLHAPELASHDLGTLVHEALSNTDVGIPIADLRGASAAIRADASQVRTAVLAMAGFLAGAATDPAAALQPTVERLNGHDPAVVLMLAGPAFTEDERDRALESVVLVRDQTREVFPGLKIASAVASLNGGRLDARAQEGGIRLALHLPASS